MTTVSILTPVAGRRLARGLASALLAFNLAACAGEEEVAIEDQPPEAIFAQAQAVEAESPDEAARLYDEIDRLYPYSALAKTAMLRSAMAYYDAGRFDESRAAAERYLDFYPSDEESPFAQYLVGLTYYDQIVDVGRDQGTTVNAQQALRETIRRYPDSSWARKARLKLDLTLDHLAGKEMEIGRFYLARQNYVAAINRFRVVIDQYQTTSHTPEALHRLTEAYAALGVIDEAQTSAAVLGHNFPGSDWYQDSYFIVTGLGAPVEENSGSWISRAFRQAVSGDWL